VEKVSQMKKYIKKNEIALFILFGLIFYGFWPLAGAENLLLEEKHKKAGLDCAQCHQEDPPTKKVEAMVCLTCHGDYKELAGKTEKIEPNPHDSHEGPISCDKCHNNHKVSQNYCAQCHTFSFKVP
jgi:hypothetical protein